MKAPPVQTDRRQLLQGLAAACLSPGLVPFVQAHEVPAARGPSPAQRRERARWMTDADAALARGDAAEAEALYDRATAMIHSADGEYGLLLAVMQRGDYRRALALAAHVAGVHLDDAPAAAFYAWLLHLGGQGAFATGVLARALQRHPDDRVLTAVQSALAQGLDRPPAELCDSPARGRPVALGESPAAGARSVGAACRLTDAQALVLAPAAACVDARQLWLRDGGGRCWAARIDDTLAAPAGLVVLRPQDASRPAPSAAALPSSAERQAFPGSAGYAVSLSTADDAAPAWPRLHLGFLGGVDASGARRLGVALPTGPLGGPVYDGAGQLIGIALGDGATQRLVPATAWATLPRLATSAATVTPAPAVADTALVRRTADELYERALPQTLQLLAL